MMGSKERSELLRGYVDADGKHREITTHVDVWRVEAEIQNLSKTTKRTYGGGEGEREYDVAYLSKVIPSKSGVDGGVCGVVVDYEQERVFAFGSLNNVKWLFKLMDGSHTGETGMCEYLENMNNQSQSHGW